MGENMENMKDIKRNQDSVFRKMSNDIDNFDSEVKSTYNKYGVEGFADKINAWRNQRVKIAVTTSSISLQKTLSKTGGGYKRLFEWCGVSLTQSFPSGYREFWLREVLVHQPSARLDP